MKVDITITRRKHGNKILEIFSITPSHSLLKKSNRAIYYYLWKLINDKSISAIYDLIEKIENGNKIINVLLYNDNITYTPDHLDTISINYRPVLGKKTCRKCMHYKKYKEKKICYVKGKEVNKNSWYKCLYWHETMNTLPGIVEEDIVYQCKTTGGNGLSDK